MTQLIVYATIGRVIIGWSPGRRTTGIEPRHLETGDGRGEAWTRTSARYATSQMNNEKGTVRRARARGPGIMNDRPLRAGGGRCFRTRSTNTTEWRPVPCRGPRGLAILVRPAPVRAPPPFHSGHSNIFGHLNDQLKPRGGGGNRPGVH